MAIRRASVFEFFFGRIADIIRPGGISPDGDGGSGSGDDGQPAGTIRFVDYANNVKYWSPEKYAAWQDAQQWIVYILASPVWADLRSHRDFRKKSNGSKIEQVWTWLLESYPGALHGYGYSAGDDSFSYLDFYYPGIDPLNLSGGYENDWQIFWSNVSPECILTVVVGAIATVATAGIAGPEALDRASKACSR